MLNLIVKSHHFEREVLLLLLLFWLGFFFTIFVWIFRVYLSFNFQLHIWSGCTMKKLCKKIKGGGGVTGRFQNNQLTNIINSLFLKLQEIWIFNPSYIEIYNLWTKLQKCWNTPVDVFSIWSLTLIFEI